MRRALCVAVAAAGAAAVGPAPQPKLPVWGPHATKVEEFKVGGLEAGGSQEAVIAYPTSTSQTFPFLSFGHGATSGGKVLKPQYSDLLRHIASFGYIIVAPMSCPDTCLNMDVDLLSVIATCKADRSLHPALPRATFDRVGIFGHSLGAVSSSKATVPKLAARHNIVANVGLHGCTAEATVTIPTFFTTGTKDPFATPALMDNCVRGNPKATPRVYADISGGGHFEPGGVSSGPHRFDPYTARFFQCHVNENSTACNDIYGDGPDALCNAYDYRTCEIVRPPTGVRYHCDTATGRCAAATEGHSTMEKCAAACAPAPAPPAPVPPAPATKYSCQGGVCVPDAAGVDPALCEAACG